MRVLLSLCLVFGEFQPCVAYKIVAYMKKRVLLLLKTSIFRDLRCLLKFDIFNVAMLLFDLLIMFKNITLNLGNSVWMNFFMSYIVATWKIPTLIEFGFILDSLFSLISWSMECLAINTVPFGYWVRVEDDVLFLLCRYSIA